MSIERVQNKSAGSTTGTSVTANLDQAPLEGNLLVIVHHVRSTSPTVTLPSGYAQAVEVTRGLGERLQIAYKIAGANESSSVTVTLSDSRSQTLSVLEYSGIDATDPLDQTGSTTGSAATSGSTGTTDTTAQADELVVGAKGLTGNGDGWNDIWTNSFVQQTTQGSQAGIGASNQTVADRITGVVGAFESTESWTTSRSHTGVIATFRAGDRGEVPSYEFQTALSIVGDRFHINGVTTYEGTAIEGALMSSRMVQAAFDDENATTAVNWKYPDTNKWDPGRNVTEFVDALPAYAANGLKAVTIGMQGGMPKSGVNGPNETTAFDQNGDIKPEWRSRLEQAIEACDDNGMVVILSLFYWKQTPRIANQAAVQHAVDETIRWIDGKGYTNVLIEIANEIDIGSFGHPFMQPPNEHILIERAQNKTTTGLKVSTSYKGGAIPSEDVLTVADYITLHGNGQNAAQVAQMVADVRGTSEWQANPRPIIFNEDSTSISNLNAALKDAGAQGWGYYDQGSNDYVNGFQSPPTNWSINTSAKQAFFSRVEELAFDESPPP